MSQPDFIKHWCVIEFKTAADQHLAISTINGEAVGWSRTADFDDFYKWMIVPTGAPNSYWLFNKGAQGSAAEALTLPESKTNFGQWEFKGEPRQTFELRDRGDGYYSLICQFNRQALSTRWSAPAFTWDYNPGDDQQKVKFVEQEPIISNPLFTEQDYDDHEVAEDIKQLKLASYDDCNPVDQTKPRTVSKALIGFPFVDDNWSIKERMNLSPYYLLQRDCYWKLQALHRYSGVGDSTEKMKVYQGYRETSQGSFEKVLRIDIGAEGTCKVSKGKEKEGKLEAGVKVTANFGTTLTWKESSEITKEAYKEAEKEWKVPAGKPVAFALWRLVNVYTLIRSDGSEICKGYYVEPTREIEAYSLEEELSKAV